MSHSATQLSTHCDTLATAREKSCLILGRIATLQFEKEGDPLTAMNKFTINVFQILICQGLGVCCPGLYPFVFPRHGYKGQLAWMESFSVIGPKAIKILHSAAKEGELSLPKFVAIKLLSG